MNKNDKRSSTERLNLEYGRIPPQAIELEEAVLGAILLEKNAFQKVAHYFKNDPIFYKEAHNIILKAIKQIYEIHGAIDLLTVTNQLKSNGELDNVGGALYITELTSRIGSAAHLDFHCKVITDKHLLRELIRIGTEMAEKGYDESNDPKEIAEWAENEIITKFNLDMEGKASFKEALQATLKDISDKAKGLVSAFIATGDTQLDTKITLRESFVCLLAGTEGCGKTKFVIHLTRGMFENNKDVRIIWFSMEDPKEQIVRSYISMDVHLTTKQLQSINYNLSDDELARISESTTKFENYNIEFVDRVVSIQTMIRKCRIFKDKIPENAIMIIIIDNFGLIQTDSFYKGTEKDDYLAGKIKELCSETGACILLLHHITKEGARKFNLREGYRPRREYIRGSNRIIDYVQQVLLINLPRKYKDLVAEEKDKMKAINIKERTGKWDKERFLLEFWSLNPKGDKNTKQYNNLQEMTWEELRHVCVLEKMPNGQPYTEGYVLKKYAEYSYSIDEKNRDRESKYQTEKESIYTFLNTKKYQHDYSPKKDSRAFYLYGENLSNAININELFIIESTKNRDGSDVENESIIRYQTNLDYNLFKEWDDGRNERMLS